MRRKRQYIVLSFASTARAMGWEKECAARGIPGRLIPLPSEITAGCGLGWRMLPEDWNHRPNSDPRTGRRGSLS